jgi:hypothetical protein
LSPLLSADGTAGSTNFGALGLCDYKGFRIRSGGALSSVDVTDNIDNFLTVQAAKDTAERPVNYYTIRVNPLTRRITTHRP